MKVVDQCKLWCVSRGKLRHILTFKKKEEMNKKVAMLEKVIRTLRRHHGSFLICTL